MKILFIFQLLTVFMAFSTNALSDLEKKSYEEALENYRSIYRELISQHLGDMNTGFHPDYQLSLSENTLYSNATEKDIYLYAKLCSLVYTKERSNFEEIKKEIEAELAKLNLEGHKLIGLLQRNLKTKPALSAILLYSPQKNHVILAFKGTVDTDNYDDWKKNLSFFSYSGADPLGALRAPNGITKLNVHRGFAGAYLEGLDEFLPQFREILAQYAEQITKSPLPVRITVTGHSLGGALSLIAANDMRRIIRTSGLIENPDKLIVENVSFASPRVYDAQSARIVEEGMGGKHNILRFVDLADIVPSVPFTLLYADHAGIPFYFGKSVYTFSIASHAMTNYLEQSPKTFQKFKSDAEYLRRVFDSIAYYKKVLGDTSDEPFEVYDRINNIKIAMERDTAANAFWVGKITEERDPEKLKEIQGFLNEISERQKPLREQLRKEEEKLKAFQAPAKSWWWPFGKSSTTVSSPQ